MTTDTPRPERVTLTDDELDRLERVEHCGSGTADVIEQILTDRLAARESALRAQIQADILNRKHGTTGGPYFTGIREGLSLAARIAGGGQ